MHASQDLPVTEAGVGQHQQDAALPQHTETAVAAEQPADSSLRALNWGPEFSDSGRTGQPALGFNWQIPGSTSQPKTQSGAQSPKGLTWAPSIQPVKEQDKQLDGSEQRETKHLGSYQQDLNHEASDSKTTTSSEPKEPTDPEFVAWAKDVRKEFKNDPEVLNQLLKLYNISFVEFVNILMSHKPFYYTAKAEAFAALAPEGGYLPYTIITGAPGVQRMGTTLDPNIKISDPAAFWTNVPLSGVDFVYNVHTFAPTRAAILQTLSWHFWTPKKDIKQYWQDLKADPKKKLGDTAKMMASFVANQAILLTHNTTGSLLNLVGVLDYFGDDPAGVIAGIAIGTYLGVRNYTLFSNPDYYEGLEFCCNSDLPYILGECFRNNKMLPLEAITEGGASVGLRTASFWGGIKLICNALSAVLSKIYGVTITVAMSAELTTFTLSMIALHAFYTRYPTTYNRLMGDLIAIRKQLLKEVGPEIEKIVAQTMRHIPLDKYTPEKREEIRKRAEEKAKEQFFQHVENERKKYAEIVEIEQGPCFRWKQSTKYLVAPSMMGGIAAFLSYKQIVPLIAACAPPWVSVPCAVLVPLGSALLLAGPSIKAQLNVAEHKEVNKLLEREAKEREMKDQVTVRVEMPETKEKPKEKSSCDCFSACSCGITAASMTLRGFGTEGALEQTPCFDIPGCEETCMVLIVKQAINGFFWTWPKIDKTFRNRWGWCCSEPEKDIETGNADTEAKATEETGSSWKCWKRNNKTEPKASQNGSAWFCWNRNKKSDRGDYAEIPDPESQASSMSNCWNIRKKVGC